MEQEGGTETGYWATSAGEAPELQPHYTSAEMSFPIPIPLENSEEEEFEYSVHYIKAGETGVEGCPGTAKEPTANPGNLCVYAGTEAFENASFFAIEKSTGSRRP